MEWFGIAVVVLLIVAALILPWVDLVRILSAETRLQRAEAEIRRLIAEVEVLRIVALRNATDRSAAGAETPPPVTVTPPPIAVEAPRPEIAAEAPKETLEAPAEPGTIPQLPQPPAGTAPARPSFEQQFGVRLPVWIGGVALALAGFFLVKFSIEQGWLTEPVRVMLGIGFGFSLLWGAGWVRRNDTTANAVRIGQSLSGAGIAVLYASFYAATTLYGLLPSFVGFAAMAAVTLTALVLSIRHGPPVALLGMIGGFLTPALVRSGNPNAATLFLYLYFLFAGTIFLVRRERWWLLGLPLVVFAFAWVLYWLFGGYYTPGDTVWLGLFLLAVSATMAAASKQQFESERDAAETRIWELFKPISILNILTLGGALTLMGVAGYRSGFDVQDWLFFGLLSAGGIGLAFFAPRLYGAVPWLAMAVNAVMLVSWYNAQAEDFAVTVAAFGVLFAASGFALQFRSIRPLLWAGLFATASLGYFLIAYFRLDGSRLLEGAQHIWGVLALVLSGLSTAATARVLREVPEDRPDKQALLAVFAGTATAFLSIGLAVELKQDFLAVAIAGEMFALAWIGTWLEIKALRYFAAALACVFAFLLFPQILLLVQLAAFGLLELQLHLQSTVPFVDSPVFQLGIPAAFFAGTAYLLRFRKDDRLIKILEMSAIALTGVMAYYLTRKSFHAGENVLFAKVGFFERGTVTNGLYVYGLACLWIGRRFVRSAVSLCGLILVGISLFRIGYFDLIAYNPVWAYQHVGADPLVNALLLTYGLPVLWTAVVMRELPALGKDWLKPYAAGVMLFLAFALVTFEVRQLFHGDELNTGEVENLEVYTYSLAWLLFSLALLFFGTLRRNYALRIASLVVMILTVGKVFLYDASQLQGLMRVLSFLGLGLSLLGISWFYTRFVFSRPAPPPEV